MTCSMDMTAFEERPVSSLDKVFYARRLDAPPLRRIFLFGRKET